MREYEGFLKVLQKKNVNNYHFADVYSNSTFLRKNDHLRKELFNTLLGLGLSTEMAVKTVQLDHLLPSSVLFILIAVSFIFLLTGVFLLSHTLIQGKAKLFLKRNGKRILWFIFVLMVSYGFYILLVFSKLKLIGWPVLLSYRIILLYILFSLALSGLSYLLITKNEQ